MTTASQGVKAGQKERPLWRRGCQAVLVLLLLSLPLAAAAMGFRPGSNLTEASSFGQNPGNLRMFKSRLERIFSTPISAPVSMSSGSGDWTSLDLYQ
ncbi:MAG: hypothetical protein V4632_04735 [Pseudomonadota bacterium]